MHSLAVQRQEVVAQIAHNQRPASTVVPVIVASVVVITSVVVVGPLLDGRFSTVVRRSRRCSVRAEVTVTIIIEPLSHKDTKTFRTSRKAGKISEEVQFKMKTT